jgi:hypothetical protein
MAKVIAGNWGFHLFRRHHLLFRHICFIYKSFYRMPLEEVAFAVRLEDNGQKKNPSRSSFRLTASLIARNQTML